MDIYTLLDSDFFGANLLNHSEEILSIFDQELPQDIEENYDIGDIIIEFIGQHAQAKQIETAERFINTLRQKQPKIYEQEHKYFSSSLIKYYCFEGNTIKVSETLANAIEPNYDYDDLHIVLLRLLYHNYIDLVDSVIVQEYQSVKNSPDLLDGAAEDLAVIKFYIELEKHYKHYETTQQLDLTAFSSEMAKFDYQFNEKFLKSLKEGLTANSLDIPQLIQASVDDTDSILLVELSFLRWMRQFNCDFTTSGLLWNNYYIYFLKKGKGSTWGHRTTITQERLTDYMSWLGGMVLDLRINQALAIWGMEYMLEYLHQFDLVTGRPPYKEQKHFIDKAKKSFKKNNDFDLWEYSFIHHWLPVKPDEHIAFEEEKVLFKESYDKVYTPSESSALPDFDSLITQKVEEQLPPSPLVKLDRKIGRNEKVSVKYPDGTIKSEVKYKKVMDDVLTGKCELI